MNMLDKLFSREIKRRTGAHAVSIYIDDKTTSRKRSRSRGSSALKASTTTKVVTKNPKGSFFHRLDAKWPWLKLFAVCVIGFIAVIDICDLTISSANDPINKVRIAPMSYHVRVTDRVLEGKKLIALTFDDGPSSATTPRLLDILAEKDVPATFFVLGNMARGNPDIVKRAKREGHIIASHTMYHQNLVRLSPEAVQADINEAKAVIKSIIGYSPTYVRPPYGNINDRVRAAVNKPMILWSVDSEDWLSKDPTSIMAVTMSEVHDGAIILMHDIYPTTLDVVPTLIDTLRNEGYEFATIKEITSIRGVELVPGEVYYNFLP